MGIKRRKKRPEIEFDHGWVGLCYSEFPALGSEDESNALEKPYAGVWGCREDDGSLRILSFARSARSPGDALAVAYGAILFSPTNPPPEAKYLIVSTAKEKHILRRKTEGEELPKIVVTPKVREFDEEFEEAVIQHIDDHHRSVAEAFFPLPGDISPELIARYLKATTTLFSKLLVEFFETRLDFLVTFPDESEIYCRVVKNSGKGLALSMAHLKQPFEKVVKYISSVDKAERKWVRSEMHLGQEDLGTLPADVAKQVKKHSPEWTKRAMAPCLDLVDAVKKAYYPNEETFQHAYIIVELIRRMITHYQERNFWPVKHSCAFKSTFEEEEGEFFIHALYISNMYSYGNMHHLSSSDGLPCPDFDLPLPELKEIPDGVFLQLLRCGVKGMKSADFADALGLEQAVLSLMLNVLCWKNIALCKGKREVSRRYYVTDEGREFLAKERPKVLKKEEKERKAALTKKKKQAIKETCGDESDLFCGQAEVFLDED
jgi:hypothetical protein